MNKRQINRLRMYCAVDKVLDEHFSLVGLYPELVSAHQLLKEGQEFISKNHLVQLENTTGMTISKNLIKADLIVTILKFSAALRAYAVSSKKTELKVRVHYVSSDLKKTPDPILFNIGTLLFRLAISVRTELVKYMVGETEIAEMEKLIETFYLAYPQKRGAVIVTKASTSNIAGMFKTMGKLLKDEIDELMLPFLFSQPDFYHAYRNARIIVDYTGRRKSKPDKPDDPEEGEK